MIAAAAGQPALLTRILRVPLALILAAAVVAGCTPTATVPVPSR